MATNRIKLDEEARLDPVQPAVRFPSTPPLVERGKETELKEGGSDILMDQMEILIYSWSSSRHPFQSVINH